MSTKYNEFISFLEKYKDELIVIHSNESEKRQALMSSDLEKLEEILQVQQAKTMKMKTLENKRVTIQEELGFKNYNAKEIIDAIDDNEAKIKLQNLFSQITELVQKIKKQNEMAIELANTNLKILDKIIQSPEIDVQNNVYSPEKNNTYSKTTSFEKMI